MGNWLAILAAVVASFVVGFIWYNPKVFGTAWMKSIGMTEEKAKQSNMAMMMGVTALMSLLFAYSISQWIYHDPMGLSPLVHGAWHGLQMAIFVALPVIVTNGLYEQKSWTNIAINAGYWMVNMAVIGLVLVALGHAPEAVPAQ